MLTSVLYLLFALLLIPLVFALGLNAIAALSLAAAALLLLSFYLDPHALLIVLSWLIFIPVGIIILHKPIRIRFMGQPLFHFFKKAAPSISKTERIALEAGTVGWEAELFQGKPDWQQLWQTPLPELAEHEKAFLEGPVRQLATMLDEWDSTYNLADLPPDVWQFLKQHRFFGMIIPGEYGGLGFSATAHSAVLRALAAISNNLASTVAVPNSLGPSELLLHYGTDEQKEKYLPRLADGREIPCFALTSPEAGSDATSLTDSGHVIRRKKNGKEEIAIRLNFNKRYITMAPVATLVGLAFRLYDPEGLLGEEEDLGISLALIPASTKGVEIGRRHYPLDVPFMNGPVRGKDVIIPLDYLIGGVEYAGKGWRMLVEVLSVGRGISLPSISAGSVAKACFHSGAYCRIRRQFQLPIGRFEGIEAPLARIAAYSYAINALADFSAALVDQGEKPALASAISKYQSTELGRQVVLDAMDIHGGKGIMLGPRNSLGRLWQGAPIPVTVEGANILTRTLMIYGQGAIRCHPWVLKELKAVNDNDIDAFDTAITGHVAFYLRNLGLSLFHGLGGGRLGSTSAPAEVRVFYRIMARFSAALALCSDTAMLVVGKHLKRRENLSARLGDVLSYLLLCSAVLLRWQKDGESESELPIIKWFCYESGYRMQLALHEFLLNLQNKWVATLLRICIFPLGIRAVPASDRLGHRVAQLMINQGHSRDLLARPMSGMDANIPNLKQIQLAMQTTIECEPLERKLMKEIRELDLGHVMSNDLQLAEEHGILTSAEIKLVEKARELAAEVIAVDDFDPSELGRKKR